MRTDETTLTLIKIIHTLIWVFFNFIIFYMLYAAMPTAASYANKLDLWLWIGYGFLFLEGITLLTFKFVCPLTLIAQKYSNSKNDNFDIYLPSWLAKYTKSVYTSIFIIIFIITIYQIMN